MKAKRSSQVSANKKASKLKLVPIAEIKIPPAMITQRVFRKAWGDDLAAELDLNLLGYPIINHRAGIYWCCDGQHRIYAMRQRGFGDYELECEVYEDLTDAEMARIFLGRNNQRTVAVFDKFHVAVTAGDKREVEIKKVVEENGQKVTRDKSEGISAVSALGAVYDRGGKVVLGQVIRAINLGFGGDPQGFDASILQGFGMMFHRFNGKLNEKDLGLALGTLRHGARELLRKAEMIRERTGSQKPQCVAAATVDLFNKRMGPRSKSRLPDWWSAPAREKREKQSA